VEPAPTGGIFTGVLDHDHGEKPGAADIVRFDVDQAATVGVYEGGDVGGGDSDVPPPGLRLHSGVGHHDHREALVAERLVPLDVYQAGVVVGQQVRDPGGGLAEVPPESRSVGARVLDEGRGEAQGRFGIDLDVYQAGTLVVDQVGDLVGVHVGQIPPTGLGVFDAFGVDLGVGHSREQKKRRRHEEGGEFQMTGLGHGFQGYHDGVLCIGVGTMRS
jgi:hypothetical protein